MRLHREVWQPSLIGDHLARGRGKECLLVNSPGARPRRRLPPRRRCRCPARCPRPPRRRCCTPSGCTPSPRPQSGEVNPPQTPQTCSKTTNVHRKYLDIDNVSWKNFDIDNVWCSKFLYTIKSISMCWWQLLMVRETSAKHWDVIVVSTSKPTCLESILPAQPCTLDINIKLKLGTNNNNLPSGIIEPRDRLPWTAFWASAECFQFRQSFLGFFVCLCVIFFLGK